MPKANLTNAIAKMPPEDREKLILLRQIKRKCGRKGLEAAQQLGLSASMMRSPDFKSEQFLQQIAEATGKGKSY
jgi:hypothetical protein